MEARGLQRRLQGLCLCRDGKRQRRAFVGWPEQCHTELELPGVSVQGSVILGRHLGLLYSRTGTGGRVDGKRALKSGIYSRLV